jgi:hypothetical protein
VFVPPPPVSAPFAFISAFPGYFLPPPPLLRPIPVPGSLLAFVPLMVVAIIGIVVTPLAPAVIIIMILGPRRRH